MDSAGSSSERVNQQPVLPSQHPNSGFTEEQTCYLLAHLEKRYPNIVTRFNTEFSETRTYSDISGFLRFKLTQPSEVRRLLHKSKEYHWSPRRLESSQLQPNPTPTPNQHTRKWTDEQLTDEQLAFFHWSNSLSYPKEEVLSLFHSKFNIHGHWVSIQAVINRFDGGKSRLLAIAQSFPWYNAATISTPSAQGKWTIQHRAYLLVHGLRLSHRDTVCNMFMDKFPELGRDHELVYDELVRAKSVTSRQPLLEYARRCSWYTPMEGEENPGFEARMRQKNQAEARERLRQAKSAYNDISLNVATAHYMAMAKKEHLSKERKNRYKDGKESEYEARQKKKEAGKHLPPLSRSPSIKSEPDSDSENRVLWSNPQYDPTIDDLGSLHSPPASSTSTTSSSASNKSVTPSPSTPPQASKKSRV